MSNVPFQEDVRHTEPNETAHRKAQFRRGWLESVAGDNYTESALKQLTWRNLGYRLGKLFGETSENMIDRIYDWCVDQQRRP